MHEDHQHQDHPRHDHDHDSCCECGCHGHNHGHDDHHHDHVHNELIPGEVSIEHHEGATVGTLVDTLHGDFQTLEQRLVTWLEALAAAVMDRGAVIGHIKASLSAGDNVSALSTVDGNVHILRAQQASTDDAAIKSQLILVAIVFNISDEQLQNAILSTKVK